MDRPVITPEHIQLLSRRKLEALARDYDNDPQPPDEDVARWRRIARFELNRRRCEVPVKDRYAIG